MYSHILYSTSLLFRSLPPLLLPSGNDVYLSCLCTIPTTSGTKRAFIHNCAKYLSLGGFCKVGYPGIVLVEGDILDVVEFVSRVQRLRWKHMVVRGEEIEKLHPTGDETKEGTVLSEDSAKDLVNSRRKFPVSFLGELTDTSDAGCICDQCGVRELFLTSMKMYSSSSLDTPET